MRGQRKLQKLQLFWCRDTRSGLLLFDDPEITQLFIDNVLLSPSTAIKNLMLDSCGATSENQPLMAGFHKNTTLLECSDDDTAFRRFNDAILRRNKHLVQIKAMLGTSLDDDSSSSSREHPTANSTTTISPPTGLWPTVLAMVGECRQGATPVYSILCNRLAT